jgi:hypothetical protein
MVEKWNDCDHIFGVVGDDGKEACVQCVRIGCGYGCIMPLEKTRDFPEYWGALGKYLAMPELTLAARAIIDDMDRKERQEKTQPKQKPY